MVRASDAWLVLRRILNFDITSAFTIKHNMKRANSNRRVARKIGRDDDEGRRPVDIGKRVRYLGRHFSDAADQEPVLGRSNWDKERLLHISEFADAGSFDGGPRDIHERLP